MNLTKAEIERFNEKYIKGNPDDCWEWLSGKYQNGYGMVCIRRDKRKTFLAHRISWMIANQREIPTGNMICHKCDNRSCVNPNHLYNGTGFDNNNDTVIRNRGNRKLGGQCSWAKLTEKDVIAILASNEKQCILAKQYGVNPSNISDIKHRKLWKHLSQVAV